MRLTARLVARAYACRLAKPLAHGFLGLGAGATMSLERDLQAERVGQLDLSAYTTVAPTARVGAVLEQMRCDRCGCALVVEEGRLVGIFTERDVLCKLVDVPEQWERPIHEFMTPRPDTVGPNDRVGAAMQRMNRGHYRNVPVVDAAGGVVGNLTHYAILQFFSDRFQHEIYNLPPEPDQVPKAPEGA
jgi:CBS domain-containing protein